MRKSKKLLSLLLAVSMLTACTVGCGNQEVANTEKPSETTSTTTSETVEETPLYNVGSLPIVNEEITLKVLTRDHTEKAWATAGESEFWNWLTEKTGIKFEVESYSQEELKSKLPLIMATPDDIPDLFIECGFTPADVLSYGMNGQLLVLDDLIEEYCPNIQEAFETVDGLEGGARAADGHIYSMPRASYSVANVVYSMNSRFMENAGLDPEKDMPTTIEELYEVFKAIRKSDANGDGTVGNEICWSADPGTFKRQALSMVGLKCYWPWSGCIFDEKDDEVFFVPTSEEYKYLLSWLHTFYDEGMLDQELFTQTGEQRTAKFTSDLVFMRHSYYDPEQSGWNGITGDFLPEVPLSSAVSEEPIITVGAYYSPDITAVAANTEYPEVCALLLDYFYTEECSKVAFHGIEGVDYVVDPKTGNDLPPSDAWKRLSGPNTMPISYNLKEWFPPLETTLGKARTTLYKTYGVMGFQNYLKFTDEQTASINTMSADLGIYCDDYYVGVITGNYDLEKTWDDYVKKCESMKADELTAIYQDAYDVFYGLK